MLFLKQPNRKKDSMRACAFMCSINIKKGNYTHKKIKSTLPKDFFLTKTTKFWNKFTLPLWLHLTFYDYAFLQT